MLEYDVMAKVKELMDGGKQASELVREIRHDELWIKKSYAIMCKLPAEALEYLKSGKMSRQAAELLSNVDASKMEAVWQRAVGIFGKDSP